MKYVRYVGVLVAAFAALAMTVGASAAVAAPEWASKGVVLGKAEPAASKGTLKLEDAGTGVQIECEGTDKGTVGPGVADKITEITPKNPCKVTKGTVLCGATANATPLGLPWETELYENANKEPRDRILTAAAGWKVECLGGFRGVDECTGKSSTGIKNNGGIVDAIFAEPETEDANCTVGGAGQGEVEGTIMNELTSKEPLEVT